MAESSPVEPIKVGPEPSRIVDLHARDTAAAPHRAATHSGGMVASLRSRRAAQRGLVAALVALAISRCLLSGLASYRTKVFLSRTIFFFFFELIKNNVFSKSDKCSFVQPTVTLCQKKKCNFMAIPSTSIIFEKGNI